MSDQTKQQTQSTAEQPVTQTHLVGVRQEIAVLEARVAQAETKADLWFTQEASKLRKFSNGLFLFTQHAENAASIAWKAALAYAIAHATYVLHLF